MTEITPSSNDRVAAMLTHIGGIFATFVPALIVYLVADDPWLKENARNALNFQLSMLIALVVSIILIIALVGILFVWAIGVVLLVLPIVAAVKANQGQTYRYPLAIELIK